MGQSGGDWLEEVVRELSKHQREEGKQEREKEEKERKEKKTKEADPPEEEKNTGSWPTWMVACLSSSAGVSGFLAGLMVSHGSCYDSISWNPLALWRLFKQVEGNPVLAFMAPEVLENVSLASTALMSTAAGAVGFTGHLAAKRAGYGDLWAACTQTDRPGRELGNEEKRQRTADRKLMLQELWVFQYQTV